MKVEQSNVAFVSILEEKLSMMKAVKKNLLNKRTEIFSTCRQRNKFLIK